MDNTECYWKHKVTVSDNRQLQSWALWKILFQKYQFSPNLFCLDWHQYFGPVPGLWCVSHDVKLRWISSDVSQVKFPTCLLPSSSHCLTASLSLSSMYMSRSRIPNLLTVGSPRTMNLHHRPRSTLDWRCWCCCSSGCSLTSHRSRWVWLQWRLQRYSAWSTYIQKCTRHCT